MPGKGSISPLSRCTQIPEYARIGCFAAFKTPEFAGMFVFKSRNKPVAKKRDKVNLAVKSWTNFRRNFIRDLKVLPHFRCSFETVAQRQPVEHTGVASINPRTAEPEKRDRPNGL